MMTKVRTAVLFALLATVGGCKNTFTLRESLSLVAAPSSVNATKDQTVSLTLDVRNSAGASVVPDSVRWSSSDPAKATVSPTGLLRAIQVTTPSLTIQAVAFRGRAQGSVSIPVTVR